MKCLSCDTEINPKWKHAIDQNVCPFCGQSILDEKLKNLFSDLRIIMDDLINYPNELADWLLSNFQFIKTDSPNIIDYVDPVLLKNTKLALKDKKTIKVKNENGEEEEIESIPLLDKETTDEFARRAGVKPNRQKELKEIADNIKKGNNGGSLILTHEQLMEIEDSESSLDSDPEEFVEQMISKSTGAQNQNDLNKLRKLVSKQKNGQGNMLGGGGAFSR